MRYIKEVLGVLGVLPLVVIHGLLRVAIPKGSLEKCEISQAKKMGEGSSTEKNERHQKGAGKGYIQRSASSLLQLHEVAWRSGKK